MRNKAIYILPLAAGILAFSLLNQSCSDMGFQPEGDYVSGWVIINDTNLIQGGYYAISVFPNKSNTFDSLPVRSDSLKLIKDYNTYRCYYRVSGLPKGSYYFAVTWIEYPVPPYNRFPVLGTWRCDTSHNCTNHELITFPNFSGASYNIISWADTSQKLN